MLIVKESIVSDDIAERRFCCDLAQCKGRCCIEGDYGAPLLEEEIPVLQRILPAVEPYMTEAGRAVIAEQGVSTLDMCAIEQAFRDGKTDFMKPVSCHLYPIRVDEYGEFTAVNYHQWDVCRCAVAKGEECGVPLYHYLREPLIRRFGQDWYDELLEAVATQQR